MSRLKRAALGATVTGTAVIGITYLSAFFTAEPVRWAPAAFILGNACVTVGLMVLGAATERGVGRLVIPFGFVWLLLVGGFASVLIAPAAAATLWGGLPPAAAIIVYGIGLVPVLVLPLAYALTFDEMTLRPGDIERVRAARVAMERGE